MSQYDKRIDDYISKSAEFAKPVLEHLRLLVHETCPEVKETMKWSFPHFEYCGSILCSMASFKQHCTFGFWLGSVMKDPHHLLSAVGEKTAMGHFGQLKSLSDLPADAILIQYIREAMELNADGVKIQKKNKALTAEDIVVPEYFLKELRQNEKALATFEKFSNSNKKDYLEWVREAKTEATRIKRMATAIAQMEEGKTRHWKYAK